MRRVPATALLICCCGTWWDKRAIDDYNVGDLHVAVQRHLAFWRHDPAPHRPYVPLQP